MDNKLHEIFGIWIIEGRVIKGETTTKPLPLIGVIHPLATLTFSFSEQMV